MYTRLFLNPTTRAAFRFRLLRVGTLYLPEGQQCGKTPESYPPVGPHDGR